MLPEVLGFLRLLQLADSALPIGGAAHSFGIEMLTATGAVEVGALPDFFRAWLEEAGNLEAAWCLKAGGITDTAAWVELNRTVAAMKPARESRAASATLGRRFLDLTAELTGDPRLRAFSQAGCDAHLAAAFGSAGRALGIGSDTAAAAFLHQSVAGQLSACQKLLPLGQRRAAGILWDLKPAILECVRLAADPEPGAASFMPAVEIASMQHPALATRLFVS